MTNFLNLLCRTEHSTNSSCIHSIINNSSSETLVNGRFLFWLFSTGNLAISTSSSGDLKQQAEKAHYSTVLLLFAVDSCPCHWSISLSPVTGALCRYCSLSIVAHVIGQFHCHLSLVLSVAIVRCRLLPMSLINFTVTCHWCFPLLLFAVDCCHCCCWSSIDVGHYHSSPGIAAGCCIVGWHCPSLLMVYVVH